jgi:hypothetical protein
LETSFERAVSQLPIHPPVAPAIVKTFGLIHHRIQSDPAWQGTCYLSTAVAHILLRAQGITTTLCIGDVMRPEGVFDHGWSEIDGAIYDVAIARPNDETGLRALPPVVAGFQLSDGKPTSLLYGTSPKSYGDIAVGLDGSRGFVQMSSITRFVDGAEATGVKLWGVILEFAGTLTLTLDRDSLRKQHETTRWTLRDSVAVPPGMTRRWRL